MCEANNRFSNSRYNKNRNLIVKGGMPMQNFGVKTEDILAGLAASQTNEEAVINS